MFKSLANLLRFLVIQQSYSIISQGRFWIGFVWTSDLSNSNILVFVIIYIQEYLWVDPMLPIRFSMLLSSFKSLKSSTFPSYPTVLRSSFIILFIFASKLLYESPSSTSWRRCWTISSDPSEKLIRTQIASCFRKYSSSVELWKPRILCMISISSVFFSRSSLISLFCSYSILLSSSVRDILIEVIRASWCRFEPLRSETKLSTPACTLSN